jgi:hypothetical protein
MKPYEKIYDVKGIKEAISEALSQIEPEERERLMRLNEAPDKEELDLSEISGMEFDDIDHDDYPDFCDAFCSFAFYKGESMTEAQLDDLNENHGEFVYDKLMSFLY